jgi:hypothetical protein
MRAVLVGCAIVAACGGSGGTPPTGDGGGGDGTNPNATKIMFTLNNVPGNAGAFTFVAAYQDGDAAWKPAPARSGDTYTFDVSSATWGFAYTCQANVSVAGVATDVRDVVEYHFAAAERTSLTEDILARCTDRITYVELSGNISSRAATGTYRVAYNGNAVFIDRTTGNYDMLVVPGTADLLVLHGNDRNTVGDFLVDGAIVQRNVAVNAAMIRNVAGNTTTSTQSLSVSVPASPAPISSETTTTLFTGNGNGTAVAMARLTKNPLASTALAGSQAAAGDVYDQRVTAELVANQAVTTTTATTTPAAVSFTAPTPLGATTTTSAAATPYPMFRSTWPGYAGAVGYTWTLAQTPPAAGCSGASNCTITWTAWVSSGAMGAMGAMPSYTMPDLSHLPGWSKTLQLVAGTMATGQVTAMTSSAGVMDFPPQPPVAGTKRVFAHSTFPVSP